MHRNRLLLTQASGAADALLVRVRVPHGRHQDHMSGLDQRQALRCRLGRGEENSQVRVSLGVKEVFTSLFEPVAGKFSLSRCTTAVDPQDFKAECLPDPNFENV